jgi:hypothetical protein
MSLNGLGTRASRRFLPAQDDIAAYHFTVLQGIDDASVDESQ